jgi:selenophosphate synthase
MRWAARRCSRWRGRHAGRQAAARDHRLILQGGESVAASRHPIAGGHTIDSVEPIYGLVAIGQVNPAHVKRNAAPAGDKLIRQGAGRRRLHAALKKDRLSDAIMQRCRHRRS